MGNNVMDTQIEPGDIVQVIWNDDGTGEYVGIISKVVEINYFSFYPYSLQGIDQTFSLKEIRFVAKEGAMLFRPTHEEEKAVQPVEWSFKNQIEEDLKRISNNGIGF